MYVKQDLNLVKKSEKRVIGSRLWSKFQVSVVESNFRPTKRADIFKTLIRYFAKFIRPLYCCTSPSKKTSRRDSMLSLAGASGGASGLENAV